MCGFLPDERGHETLLRTAIQAELGQKTQVHAVSDGAAWIADQVSEQFGLHGHFLCTPLRHPGPSQAGRRLVETEKRQAHAGAACLPCQPGVGQLLAAQTTTGGLTHSGTSNCARLSVPEVQSGRGPRSQKALWQKL